ncbi:MAG TPA: potassium channel family protein [Isosphaeraceae bacterium]|nr:potassium channel family protein [Isosphaeraceae bacterium]
MSAVAAVASVLLIYLVLLEAFETMILPRRVTRHFRFTRLFYLFSWSPWSAVARLIASGRRRGTFLSLFGPLSILALFGFWAVGLIFGFALLHWSLGTPLNGTGHNIDIYEYFYFSGVTFFTLGFGDVTPSRPLGRFLAITETGIGFGFLAVVISYLPVLYQAFSRREVTISLFDARAGSPPTAGTLLARNSRHGDVSQLIQFLAEWERWSAEVLESHISYPVLSFYRSQHDNQSWLAALTAVLDASALVVAGAQAAARAQAYMTFAMARHVVVDLAQALQAPPVYPETNRLGPERAENLWRLLREAGLELTNVGAIEQQLAELRGMYEPFVHALSLRFMMPLPPVFPEGEPVDNWQTSAWMRRTRGFRQLADAVGDDDHED